jgi:hypothetical protein
MGLWKDAVGAYFKEFSSQKLPRMIKDTKEKCQNSQPKIKPMILRK